MVASKISTTCLPKVQNNGETPGESRLEILSVDMEKDGRKEEKKRSHHRERQPGSTISDSFEKAREILLLGRASAKEAVKKGEVVESWSRLT